MDVTAARYLEIANQDLARADVSVRHRHRVRRAAPFLKRIASVAVPIVSKAIGGPLGGLVTQAAGSLLGQGEYETHELAHEFEQHEFETQEAAHEVAHEQFSA